MYVLLVLAHNKHGSCLQHNHYCVYKNRIATELSWMHCYVRLLFWSYNLAAGHTCETKSDEEEIKWRLSDIQSAQATCLACRISPVSVGRPVGSLELMVLVNCHCSAQLLGFSEHGRSHADSACS